MSVTLRRPPAARRGLALAAVSVLAAALLVALPLQYRLRGPHAAGCSAS